jgi:circadian clock protein KaiC
VSEERVSTGVPGIDAMLGGRGVYRGSSVLVSGMPGSGKSTIAAHFVDASCRRGERSVYFAFEESAAQIVRNMRSVGLDLQPWIDRGLLSVEAGRPQLNGLEMHLAIMHKVVREKQPRLVAVDPISNLAEAGTLRDAHALLTRLFDFLGGLGITGVYTSLAGERGVDATDIGISSIIDTWLVVRDRHVGGERTHALSVIKARGMSHSNHARELHFSNDGIELRDLPAPVES